MKFAGNPEIAHEATHRLWRIRMLVLHGSFLAVPAAFSILHSKFWEKPSGFCLIKAAFGIDCPACGITHAATAIFSGNLSESFIHHPSGLVILTLLFAVFVYLTIVTPANLNSIGWRHELFLYRLVEVLACGALIVGWIFKLFYLKARI